MKIYNILAYYILILIGLIGTSWIIWSRFIRERTIRDIPDALLTEYRFWLLLYICCIYFYVVKNLIKEAEPHIIFIEISKIISTYFWKPLITLDHAIKYNKYCKDRYHNFIIINMMYWDMMSSNRHYYILFGFQIIPRIFLVVFLLMDTFYFHKLELFYKCVLIGLLPFIFRYIQYCIKDFYENLVKQLTDKYDMVDIFEKGYSYDLSRKKKTEAIWHYDRVSVEIYIEVMHDTLWDKPSYEYEGHPYCKDEVYDKYKKQFNKPVCEWTSENYEEAHALFKELSPQIINLKFTMYLLQLYKKERIIVWSKIGIFTLYLICWSYILIISYYKYPIELPMFEYLMRNIMQYLVIGDDPFINNIYSINKNLITIQSIKGVILNIINNLIK